MPDSENRPHKLGTYEGVFIPTTLNVLSILIYLRFGFVVGQAGVLGSLLLLVLSYAINLLTTMSLSAIATNGVVKGGGAYYMISRSLGPEFGGSIGVVFYIGQVLNAGLNVAGFADPLINNFGDVLPNSPLWVFTYQTLLLLACTVICLLGPQLFARSSKLLFYILLVATLAVPVSTLIVKSYYDEKFDAWYTGPSWATFTSNWYPEFTSGAAGSNRDTKEDFSDLFGIVFSATAGILAGASMSGDLNNPSKSIPSGTLWGLLLTFALYGIVIVAIGGSVSRDMLRRNIDVISSVNASPSLVMLGEFATSIFSALMGVLGAAKLLQAIARDDVVPFLKSFASGVGPDDNPIRAILLTYLLTQMVILLDVNRIAVYITMALLMTFVVLNLACFLLKVSSAPNFRPSFRYFSARTAGLGFAVCIAAMLCADVIAALAILLLGLVVFVVIYAYSGPKPWGDVSQSILYHQVRKYLLKLRQDHVKYWRPQILLFVDDPRSGWQLIRFCNYLKKGGLFILGHVVVSDPAGTGFEVEAAEISKQRSAWEKLRDMHHIKAFFQVSASPSVVYGARNVFLGSGLGGMKPNICVLGFYDEAESGQNRAVDVEELPTDSLRHERHCTLPQWVQIIEDLLILGSNVFVAKGFMEIDLPAPKPIFKWMPDRSKLAVEHHPFIDLYPIQMSARLMDSDGNANGISINFDTYTLILQLGSILHSVKAWKATHKLRVVAFVEKSNEVKRETVRITELLNTLRIDAEVKVQALDTGNSVYDIIVKGHKDTDNFVAERLKESAWYQKLCEARKGSGGSGNIDLPASTRQATYIVPQVGSKKKRTLSSLQQLGVAHSIQATKWAPESLKSFYDLDEDHALSSSSENDDVQSPLHLDTPQKLLSPKRKHKKRDIKSPTKQLSMTNQPQFDSTEAGPSFQDDPMDASQLASPIQTAAPKLTFVEPVPERSNDLKFNDLPASSQHLILNCLMKTVSKDTTVIFSTLPPPAIGTHKDEQLSKKYHRLLEIMCEGLPPIALVNAQSMTVTTAL